MIAYLYISEVYNYNILVYYNIKVCFSRIIMYIVYYYVSRVY